MAEAQTWRVVLATGEVREVVLHRSPHGYSAEGDRLPATLRATDPVVCVAAQARRERWDVREILAPGEPTREEITAALAAVQRTRQGVAAEVLDMLSRGLSAADIAAEYAVGDVGDALATARREGAEEMREAATTACERIAQGADDALITTPAHESVRVAYLKGRRRGAELCADALRNLPLPGDALPTPAPTPAPVCPALTEGT